ncbi:ComEA family DNA-binding protein [Salipaludibacillus sp. CF4.18]|uniref:ComEA family DNA-binding protein n=1 Tax=Salipaludibacillus sp. CF4.18 TaxID=3373081 RepID=UPI003EE56AE0
MKWIGGEGMFKRMFVILVTGFLVWKVIIPFLKNQLQLEVAVEQDELDKIRPLINDEVEPNSGEEAVFLKKSAPSDLRVSEESFLDEVASVSINHANLEELLKLPGVGADLGSKILDYRNLNGDFQDKKELLAVPGIGEKKLLVMEDSFHI